MNMQRFFIHASICAAFVASLVLTSCDLFPPEALTIPQSYDSTTFRTNATTELRLKSTLVAFVDSAKTGRIQGRKVTVQTLQSLYTSGSPSLSDITTAWYRPRMATYITELANASGTSYDPARTPAQNGQGGVFGIGSGAYLFDENGLEMEQMIEKGLFGAALYNHALTLVAGDMPLANVDKFLAIYGASPSFRNSDNVSKHGAERDFFSAAYSARRCDNSTSGLYRAMQRDFIKLQAAVKAGSRYSNDRRAAIDSLLLNWERTNAATVINYCIAVTTTMSKTTTTLDERARALHAYGECVGFLTGWRTVSRKRITDAQIDQYLALLKAPIDGTPTSFQFITDPVSSLPNLQTVIAGLRGIYGFSDMQMDLFRRNLVNEQMR
ncbi:MAG: hypothetical protein EAZ92_15545 [Candidatus Kapaibacterium sp.]|nr:MAG: hypothetical protein EAZ92_15545 [Candidatus Kapabacteria bacterium]